MGSQIFDLELVYSTGDSRFRYLYPQLYFWTSLAPRLEKKKAYLSRLNDMSLHARPAVPTIPISIFQPSIPAIQPYSYIAFTGSSS